MEKFIIQAPKGERIIGPGQPVFIVAEMSANHNQDFKRAFKIIDAAVKAGADAVKLQTYTPDTITIDCDKEYFQVKANNAWAGETFYSLYQKAYTPWDWQPKLKEYAERQGVMVYSTPFDNTAVDFLEKMNVQLYNIAPYEIVDIPLLKRMGKTKKPVIISRGMASLEEMELAVKTLKANGAPQVAILHCISSYPAEPEQMKLATIPDIAQKLGVITGLSDHTRGVTVPIVSTVLGASIIENHLTLSRADGGTDAGFSLEPDEFRGMIQAVREAEKAIGMPGYKLSSQEAENAVFRKSLFVVEDIKKGEQFTAKNVRSIRPGQGLAPKYYDEVMGKTVTGDVERGTPLSWDLIN